MLFYNTSRNDLNIIKIPNFLSIFQHRKNSLQFRKLKKLNQSENPLQSLTATDFTSNLSKHTTVRNFLRIRNLLKREYDETTGKSQKIRRQMLRRIYMT